MSAGYASASILYWSFKDNNAEQQKKDILEKREYF